MRRLMVTRFGVVLLFLTALSVQACTTQQAQLQEADRLAKAGKAFSESLPTLYDSYFETTVEVDSIQLSRQRDLAIEIVDESDDATRDAVAEAQRTGLETGLDKTNDALKRQLEAIRAAKQHAEALRAYFVGLEAFTSDDTGAGTGEALKDLSNRVVSFSDDLQAAATSSPINLDSVAEVAGEYVVLGVKSAKLSAHLQAHGADINEALVLQARFIEAIDRNMRADLTRKAMVELRNPLFGDYKDLSGTLPSDWGSRRRELLEFEVGTDQLDDALRAASSLQQSWMLLAEGDLSAFALATLIADVEAAISVIQRVRADQEASQ